VQGLASRWSHAIRSWARCARERGDDERSGLAERGGSICTSRRWPASRCMHHARAAIGFSAPLVDTQGLPGRAAERAIWLGDKVAPTEAASFPGKGPPWLVHTLVQEQGREPADLLQRERDDIGGSERLLRQVREEQPVRDALSGEADATLLLGSRMGRHYDARAEPCWSSRHVRVFVERAHQPTFRAGVLLIGGKLEASLHLGSLKYPIVFAPRNAREALQGTYDSSCA
jgi:hypothetical protein